MGRTFGNIHVILALSLLCLICCGAGLFGLSTVAVNAEKTGGSTPEEGSGTPRPRIPSPTERASMPDASKQACSRPDVGSAVPEPKDLRSRDGVLKVALTVRNETQADG